MKATRKYLRDLLDESDELTDLKVTKRQYEIDSLNQDLAELIKRIKKIKDDIEKDLQFANDHFILNEKFVDKRDFFTDELSIELNNYQFKEKLFSETQFEKLFSKLNSIDSKNTTNVL